MIGAVVILSVMGAVWAVGGLIVAHLPLWTLGTPILIAVALAVRGTSAMKALPARTPDERRRIGRLIALWSAIELMLIVVVANLLANTGHLRDALPATAIIVGLHFFPLARGTPQPAYYTTGGLLTVLGLAGVVLPDPYALPAVGLGAAIILWTTCIWLSRSLPRRHAAQSASC